MRFTKSFASVTLLLLLCISMAGSLAGASPGTVLSTDPRNKIAAPGSTENEVFVTISDVSFLYGYEFKMYYNTTMINVTDMAPHLGTTNEPGFFFPNYQVWKYEINDDPWGNGTGYVWLSLTLPYGTKFGLSGSGKLATIEFSADVVGRSALTFPLHLLGEPTGEPIAHTVLRGSIIVGEVAGVPPEANAGGPYRGAVNASVTFNGTASSDPDGTIESWEWDFGDGSPLGTGAIVDHVYNAIGNYTVALTVKDNDGLIDVDVTTVEIVVDKTPPSDGYVRIAGGSQYTNKTSVTLKLYAYDAESGVNGTRLSNDNSTWTNWEAYATSKSWTLAAGPDGTRTVYAQFKDKAGNPSQVFSGTIKLDTTPPTLTIALPSEGAEIKSSSVDVQWSGSDDGSQINHYEVKLDDGSWTNVGSDTTRTFSGLADFGHTVHVRAVDNAGNVQPAQVSFTVNTSWLGGPGYMEEIALGAVVAIAVIGVVVYFLKFRKKT